MIQKKEFYNIYKNLRENILISQVLIFASFFYKLIYRARLLLYKLNFLQSNKLPVKVISIGNLTCGGTGKTPLTIEVAKHFIKKGYKVAILSRGYKKINPNENILVSDGNSILCDVEVSGDEPFLIAKKVPKAIVLSGSNRIKSSQSAIKLGANIIILDDGFQHLKLQRDENILILDSTRPLDNGYLLPRGELREEISSVERATSIIFSNAKSTLENDKIIQQINLINPNIPIYFMEYKVKCLKGINTKLTLEPNEIKDKRIISFCGIGNPNSFLNTIKELGLEVVQNISFEDHYNYNASDISNIIRLANNYNITNILTTEKDAIKLEYLCESAPVNFWYLDIEVSFKNNNISDLLKNIVTTQVD